MTNAIIFFISCGVVFLISGLFTPAYSGYEIRETPISGRIVSFQYKYVYGGRISPTGPTYIVKLNNYNSNFIIQIDNYYSFDQKFFEKTVKKGDSMNLVVLKEFVDSKNKSCSLFEVSKGKTKYLTKNDSLSDYNNGRKILLSTGGICLFITLILYFLKEKYNW